MKRNREDRLEARRSLIIADDDRFSAIVDRKPDRRAEYLLGTHGSPETPIKRKCGVKRGSRVTASVGIDLSLLSLFERARKIFYENCHRP